MPDQTLNSTAAKVMTSKYFAFFMVMMTCLAAGCGGITDAEEQSPWLNREAELLEHNRQKITIEEGLSGTMLRREGDCMRGPGPGESTCILYPVPKRIKIFEYTHISQTSREIGQYYTRVDTKLIATVQSDGEGFFQIPLPAGTYSVFPVSEDGRYIVTGADGQGGLNPLVAEEGEVPHYRLIHNRAAF